MIPASELGRHDVGRESFVSYHHPELDLFQISFSEAELLKNQSKKLNLQEVY
jgi:hypothetical protein